MVSKVTQLLREYQDLSLTELSNMKEIIEAVEDIVSWVEARLHVEAGIKKCRMPLLWCSLSYWLCWRWKDLSELKIWPLGESTNGSVGTVHVLTACINAILGNLPPLGQDLCQIWCLQCIVMTYFGDGFYKKTSRPVEITLRISLSLTIASMSADREL